MQIKEFSFILPVIESALVFKAIGTVIPPDAIAQTVGNTDSVEERRKLPSQLVVCLVIATRKVVVGFNDHRPQKSCQWLESAVDKTGEVLASAEQCLDYNRSTTNWVSGNEPIICANSATASYS